MHLLEYRPLTDPHRKPTAPIEVFTQGMLEETITDWYWNENPLFKYGWLPTLRKINFEHPKMITSIDSAHREQKESLSRRGYRYPHY